MLGSERPGDLPKVSQLESGKTLLNRRFLPLPWGHASHWECGKLRVGNPRDGGAWWAAIYGVAQSQTTEAT